MIQNQNSKMDLFSSYIFFCTVYTYEVMLKMLTVVVLHYFKSRSINDLSLKYTRVISAARINRLMHSNSFGNSFGHGIDMTLNCPCLPFISIHRVKVERSANMKWKRSHVFFPF